MQLEDSMADARDTEIGSDAEMIDEVLLHVPELAAQVSTAADGPVPQPPDLRAIARGLGLQIKRGVPGPDFKGIAIPDFYSEREARLAMARRFARIAVERVGSQCSVTEDAHNCPDPVICDFVESAKSNDNLIDKIAAAVLMPTNDFVRWARFFGGEEEPLSDSYAVPRALARIRLRTMEPTEPSVQP